jgi:cell division protein FtsZ
MSIKLHLPKLTDMRPRLTVIGVGGAGCNAVNNMIAAGLTGVEFVVANTDAQCLLASSAEHRIQLGASLTEGLGAGSKPEIGEAAAEEAIDEIKARISGAHMVFIAAGMGGGTGTGAAAVIARASREMGILTVGVVTKPFQFEGTRRLRIAEAGIVDLRKAVDTLIVIPNQNLFRIANEKTTFAEAFVLADQVLYSGVACIVDLIVKEGLINLDFADVRTVVSGMGTAMMGTGEASGERRAIIAAEEAISNPLLEDVTLQGARGLLLSITGGRDLTLYEVDEAASRVRKEVDPEANIIVGATFDETLGDRVRVSIVASGMLRNGEEFAGSRPPEVAPRQKMDAVRGHSAAGSHLPPGVSPHGPVTAKSAPPMPPPMERTVDQDVERRLSEAIQYGPSGDTYASLANPPAHAATVRDAWQAPGNVTIEDGLTQLTPAAPTSRPASGSPHATAPPAGFTPAPPADLRRPARRMPEVEDFPPLAQAEYRAKAPGSSPPPSVAQAEPRRKGGLFSRIAGIRRRPDDSPPASPASTLRAEVARAQQGTEERPRTTGEREPPHSDRASGRTKEDVDLPVFFDRGRG